MRAYQLAIVAVCTACSFAAMKVAHAGSEAVLHSFAGSPDGSRPTSSLTGLKGTVFGLATGGGTFNEGEFFKVTPAGQEMTLYSFFKGQAAGAGPSGSLLNVGGTFYGTTPAGGVHITPRSDPGTVFKVSPAGLETVVYSFKGGYDGAASFAALIEVGKELYGTTLQGGGNGCSSQGCGTVFKITLAGRETVIYRFRGGSDGAAPYAALVNLGGTFYGTTSLGGGAGCAPAAGCGTLFKMSPAGVVTILHVFTGGGDGASPHAALVNLGGTLYGTTMYGGSTGCGGGCGTVFKLSPSGDYTQIYVFKGGMDGALPTELLPVGGSLFGMTVAGGGFQCSHAGCGTIFSLLPSGSEKITYAFQGGMDGSHPVGHLLQIGSVFYGLTYDGGSQSQGTIFEFAP